MSGRKEVQKQLSAAFCVPCSKGTNLQRFIKYVLISGINQSDGILHVLKVIKKEIDIK